MLPSLQNSSGNDSDSFDAEIVNNLRRMLDEHNPLTQSFRNAKDMFDSTYCPNLKIRLIGRRDYDGRTYNLPTASEVAALIVGDITGNSDKRDMVVQTRGGILKPISELHPSYLPIQYPLLFLSGEDGYRVDIPFERSNNSSSTARSRVIIRQFFAYRIQDRINEGATILSSRKLFQQFLVDAYTMVESERLSYIREHQKKLRSEKYNKLSELFRCDGTLQVIWISRFIYNI